MSPFNCVDGISDKFSLHSVLRNQLVYIRGKKGTRVPIILTPVVVKSVKLLIKTRSDVGVVKKNRYVFAAPTRNSLKFIRGNDCLAAVVKRCDGIEKPEAIQGTKLRKYVATVSQIIALEDNELDWLARHLGHDIKVHREYYRLQDSTLELAKVSKLLMAVDG